MFKLTFIICFLVLSSVEALGQSTATSSAAATATKPRRLAASTRNRDIVVTENFQPSFNIEPLSHAIEGRAGDVISFRFKIQSANREAKIEVAPIGLRQELNGQIMHDEQAEKSSSISLLTPTSMVLQSNVPATIEGVVKLPRGEAKHHSVGILVRDIGAAKDFEPKVNADGSKATQAGIHFITQYVLRLDLTVQGARGEDGHQLVVESTKITPFEGRPRLESTVFNPTDTTFEFELRGRLRNSPSDRSFKPLRMVMPVRKSVEDEGRYIGRILPKTRLKMEELLPEAIAGGHYDADMELSFEGRVVNRKTVSLDVDAQDFPAQEVLITQVDEGLQVSPAQIELSQVRGGSRRITMLLKNNSKDTKTIRLSAFAKNGLAIDEVMIQPSDFQLSPGGSRKTALTLRSQSTDDRVVQYGSLLVEANSTARDYQVSRELPLAIILKDITEPHILQTPLQWDPSYPYPSFRARLENTGDTHLALQSRLTITSEAGQRTVIPGGFGRWLMPHSSTQLEFRLDQPLLPGKYHLRCEIQRPGEPLVSEQLFTVTDMDLAE